MSEFPLKYDTFVKLYNGIDSIDAAHINNIQSAIIRIEKILGLGINGEYTTVSERIGAIESMTSVSLIDSLYETVTRHIALSFEANGVTTDKTITVNPAPNVSPITTNSITLNRNLNSELWNGYRWQDLIDMMNGHNEPDFDTGWFTINAGQHYVLTHNLNTQPKLFCVLLSNDVGTVSSYYFGGYSIGNAGSAIYINDIRNRTLTLNVGSNGWVSPVTSATVTTGSCRIFVWKGAPWKGFAPDYESNWIPLTANMNLAVNHYMDSPPKLFQVFLSTAASAAAADSNYYTPVYSVDTGALCGVSLTGINASTFNIKTYNTWPGPNGTPVNTGFIKVMAWRGESRSDFATTTSPLTLYINSSYAGVSDGTYARPYKNMSEAFGSLPTIIKHPVTFVFIGTYNCPSDIVTTDRNGTTSTALIYMNNLMMTGNGMIILTGSTETSTDTILDCHTTPGASNSAPYCDNAIHLDGIDGRVIIKNMNIIGFGKHGIFSHGTNDLIVDNVVVDQDYEIELDDSYDQTINNIEIVDINQCDITNTSSVNSSGNGLLMVDCYGKLDTVIASGNKNGLVVVGGKVTIDGSTFSNNDGHGVISLGHVTIDDSIASNNIGYGIYAVDNGHARATECTVAGNNSGIVGDRNGTIHTANCSGENAAYGLHACGGSQIHIVDEADLRVYPTATDHDNDIIEEAADFARCLYLNPVNFNPVVPHYNRFVFDLTSDCVAFYKLDENAGTTAVADVMGLNNAQASVNTSVLHSTTSKLGTGSFSNFSLTQYVKAVDSETLSTGSNACIECWIRADEIVNTLQTAVSKFERFVIGFSANMYRGWAISINSEGKIVLDSAVRANSMPQNSSGGQHRLYSDPINVGQWYHVVANFWYDQANDLPTTPETQAVGRIQLYLNGMKIQEKVLSDQENGRYGSNDMPFWDPNNASVFIGVMGNGNSPYTDNSKFRGQVDNVRIYNRSLTQYEIQALYNNGIGTESLSSS